MPYWDERVQAISRHYPDVVVDKFHIDILTAHIVQRPNFFDVVVGSKPKSGAPRTPDLGGSIRKLDMGLAIAKAVCRL